MQYHHVFVEERSDSEDAQVEACPSHDLLDQPLGASQVTRAVRMRRHHGHYRYASRPVGLAHGGGEVRRGLDNPRTNGKAEGRLRDPVQSRHQRVPIVEVTHADVELRRR